MSKHHRTAGVDFRQITIDEKTYTMRPFTVGMYAEMEAYIVSKRPDPLTVASEAVSKLPSNQHDAIWKAAMNQAVNARTVTAEEATVFENSVEGLSWKVWQSLKCDHPEIDSPIKARELLVKAGEEKFEEIALAVEIASGEADLKKSTGQADQAEVDPAGQSSIEISQKPMDGDQSKLTD